MLTKEQIEQNTLDFQQLIYGITRQGANKDLLQQQLSKSDFYTAPASAKYHGAYEGGLCEHCLGVYRIMSRLNNDFEYGIDEDSIRIVSLLHDFSKMNFYKTEVKNEKVYSPNGSKSDSMGRFDWVSKPGYGYRTVEEGKLVLGNHEETSAFMANTFIPLTVEEYSAILHHMGGKGWDSAQDNLSDVYQKYRLALLLHIADMMESYDSENNK